MKISPSNKQSRFCRYVQEIENTRSAGNGRTALVAAICLPDICEKAKTINSPYRTNTRYHYDDWYRASMDIFLADIRNEQVKSWVNSPAFGEQLYLLRNIVIHGDGTDSDEKSIIRIYSCHDIESPHKLHGKIAISAGWLVNTLCRATIAFYNNSDKKAKRIMDAYGSDYFDMPKKEYPASSKRKAVSSKHKKNSKGEILCSIDNHTKAKQRSK